mmetsp:Transcript_81389/g.128721  ORF Transcript_81389/g.128721 Transcript_81389/m.128721 type:complete len:256 (-) Transcript_81389:775-1542(-)
MAFTAGATAGTSLSGLGQQKCQAAAARLLSRMDAQAGIISTAAGLQKYAPVQAGERCGEDLCSLHGGNGTHCHLPGMVPRCTTAAFRARGATATLQGGFLAALESGQPRVIDVKELGAKRSEFDPEGLGRLVAGRKSRKDAKAMESCPESYGRPWCDVWHPFGSKVLVHEDAAVALCILHGMEIPPGPREFAAAEESAGRDGGGAFRLSVSGADAGRCLQKVASLGRRPGVPALRERLAEPQHGSWTCAGSGFFH